jgi:hypothetical protein
MLNWRSWVVDKKSSLDTDNVKFCRLDVFIVNYETVKDGSGKRASAEKYKTSNANVTNA